MACALHRVGATAKQPTTSCLDNRKRTRLPALHPGHAAAVPLATSASACRACACARRHLCRAHCRRMASSARHLATSPPRQVQETRAQHRVPFTRSWLCPMLTDDTVGCPTSAYSACASSRSGTPSAAKCKHRATEPFHPLSFQVRLEPPPPPVTYVRHRCCSSATGRPPSPPLFSS
jgi:hypothetical protein